MRTAPPGFADLPRRLPVSEAARRNLRRRLTAAGRHYHGAAHVALLWRGHRGLRAGGPVRGPRWDRLVACAIAFHDAVYDVRRADNEAASARLWRGWARRLNVAEVHWVERTMLATADHLAPCAEPRLRGPARLARSWVLDLDLMPLGARPAVFEANTRSLRREAACLADAASEVGRIAFLRRMAAEPCLFRTRKLAARFGGRARANLGRALAEA